jgi:quercetin dioxygenase-like cupin family protein
MLTIEPTGAVLGDKTTISSIKFGRLKLAVAASLMAGALLFGPASRAAGEDAGAQVKPVLAQTLPNVPGKSLTAVVFVFVLSGAVQSESSATGPVKVYKAGESFFEPPGSEHLVSENASVTEPASLLAVFVADDGAQLTTFDK